jgi:hypothetical protein
MREWCSCGAAIHSTPKRVRAWRAEHRHEVETPAEPDKQGSSSSVERSYQADNSEVRIGFVPNR